MLTIGIGCPMWYGQRVTIFRKSIQMIRNNNLYHSRVYVMLHSYTFCICKPCKFFVSWLQFMCVKYEVCLFCQYFIFLFIRSITWFTIALTLLVNTLCMLACLHRPQGVGFMQYTCLIAFFVVLLYRFLKQIFSQFSSRYSLIWLMSVVMLIIIASVAITFINIF